MRKQLKYYLLLRLGKSNEEAAKIFVIIKVV